MSEAMNWTLLAPSTIRLFGWVLNGFPALAGAPAVPQTAGLATTVPVDPGQLAAANYVGRGLTASILQDPNAQLAHILAYTYGGSFAQLRVPAIFLVSGNGEPVLLGGNIDPGRLGLAYLDNAQISFANNLQFWTYNINDPMIRLDPSSGTLQELVIDAETGGSHGRRRIDLVGQDGSFSGRFGGGH